jgi:hypothetical protein
MAAAFGRAIWDGLTGKGWDFSGVKDAFSSSMSDMKNIGVDAMDKITKSGEKARDAFKDLGGVDVLDGVRSLDSLLSDITANGIAYEERAKAIHEAFEQMKKSASGVATNTNVISQEGAKLNKELSKGFDLFKAMKDESKMVLANSYDAFKMINDANSGMDASRDKASSSLAGAELAQKQAEADARQEAIFTKMLDALTKNNDVLTQVNTIWQQLGYV